MPAYDAMHRRHFLARLAGAAVAAGALAGCAGFPGVEPLRVELVDVAQIPGEAMELRLAVKLRVQNPNDAAVDFQGVSLTLEVRGASFASGVSPEAGTVPGFGERVITVPVSIGAFAAARQIIGLVTDQKPKFDYVMRGRLGGAGIVGGHTFESRGVLELPAGFGASAPPAQ
jgi:LEA14-like dessication related protein